jgi:Toprim domain-containing protein
MNIETANNIPIKDMVETIGGLKNGIQKGNSEEYWYLSPFREEKQASFKINIATNRWIDWGHGMNRPEKALNFVTAYHHCSTSRALEIIEESNLVNKSHKNNSLFSFPVQRLSDPTSRVNSKTTKQLKGREKEAQLRKYYEEEHKKELGYVPKINAESIKSQKPTTGRVEVKKLITSQIKSLQNTALLDYLESRKIEPEISKKYCKEIYFKNTENGKNYFAISFTNDSGAYEIRNKYHQGIIGSKDITSIYNNTEDSGNPKSNKLSVFEGFMDFLSYMSDKNSHSDNPQGGENTSGEDFIILNSVALVNKFIENILDSNSSLKNDNVSVYGNTHKVESKVNIDLYLDNDRAGDEATQKIIEKLSNQNIQITDKRNVYSGYKDYNDYLCSKYNQK